MSELIFQRYLRWTRISLCLLLAASVAYYVFCSIHWQVNSDTSIMHYVVFLMKRGLTPYRDITDCNLPGAYFMESWAMSVFGSGDIGWRFYDYSLLAILIGSMVAIALPYDWFAGILAGVVFVMVHAAQGPRNAVQREQLMSTLLVAGYALLFTGLRKHRPILLFPFELLLGLAASLKPTTIPLGMLLLGMACLPLRKQRISVKPYLAYGVAGAIVALLFNVQFFLKHGDWTAFLEVSNRLIRYYASAGNSTLLVLLRSLLAPKFAFLLLAGLCLMSLNGACDEWENWERRALLVGILFGAFSFIAQRKGFDYQLYPFIIFLYLWAAIEIAKAFKTKTWRHSVAILCLAVGFLVQLVRSDLQMKNIETNQAETNEAETSALLSDLSTLGGPSLSRQVQCFDMVAVCFNVLNRMELLPYSNFMGDYMFFGPRGSSPNVYYRSIMWDELHRRPAKVIVVTNMWLTENNSFDKLKQWPELANYLSTDYKLAVTRTFGGNAYRIYTLNGVQLP